MSDGETFFEDTSDYDKNPDRFLDEMKQVVADEYNIYVAQVASLPRISINELYVVWFSKTLQNWKSLVSTSRSGDGLYFEITHNGDKGETYVDTYIKTKNTVYKDTEKDI
jgi:hypothetical protein